MSELNEIIPKQEFVDFLVVDLGLTKSETFMVCKLYGAPWALEDREIASTFLDSARPHVRRHIQRLRKKLNLHGIRILRTGKGGFVLAEEGRAKIEALIKEKRQRCLTAHISVPPRFLELGQAESAILELFMNAASYMTLQVICADLAQKGHGASDKSARKYISHLRQSLSEHQAEIEAANSFGYRLSDEGKEIVRTLLEAAKDFSVPQRESIRTEASTIVVQVQSAEPVCA